MEHIIVVTGASSGFGALAVRSLARAGAGVSAVADAIVKVVDTPFRQATFSGAHRPDAGWCGSCQCSFGPCPRRASSSDRPRRPPDTAGPRIPIAQRGLVASDM